MKTKKTYQVWALYPTESGTKSWHPVTRKYATKTVAHSIANALWLDTRVDEEDADGDDEQ